MFEVLLLGISYAVYLRLLFKKDAWALIVFYWGMLFVKNAWEMWGVF